MTRTLTAATFPFAAVLFDLDGVIADTTELHYKVWKEFAAQHNYTPTGEELLATNGRRAAETLRLWLGQSLDDQAVATLTTDRETLFNRMLATEPVPPVPGVGRFVQMLKAGRIPKAVVTSAVPANATLALERVELRDAFDVIITAADVVRGKPDPEPYLMAARRLSVAPNLCLVVEDSIPGIRAAKAAGSKCLALTTTFSREMLVVERPDWIARDFNALKDEWPAEKT
jgi:HAD superfamily hydrolase (TIGR01509 family)